MILINKSYIISSPFSSFFKTSNGALSPRKGTGLHNHSLKASSEVCSFLPKDHIKSDTPSIGNFTSCPLEIKSCLSVSIRFFIDILFSYIDFTADYHIQISLAVYHNYIIVVQEHLLFPNSALFLSIFLKLVRILLEPVAIIYRFIFTPHGLSLCKFLHQKPQFIGRTFAVGIDLCCFICHE